MSGNMRDEPVEVWKNKIWWYLENRHFKDMNRIDESRWSSSGKYSQESQRWASSKRIPKFMTKLQNEPEQFKGKDHLHVDVPRH